MNTDTINKKQNDERMLRYQYAARRYYNRAENMNYIAWFLCITSCIITILPVSSNWETSFTILIFIMDIAALIITLQVNTNVSYGAAFRKHFDKYVLEIQTIDFADVELRKLEEKSIQEIQKSQKTYKEQISNTGHDNPPGVRNWYEFSVFLAGNEAIFECQKQNCWWNQKMTQKRLAFSLALFVCTLLMFALLLTINENSDNSSLQFILGLSPLALKAIERIIENAKYYHLSIKISGAEEILTKSKSFDSIKALQDKIDERRSLPVLESNLIHSKCANVLSKLYQKITQKLEH